ncbi:MAG TPA: diaminopimelate decarboxylase [Woeseiaceae bacterium]|nr:diaminopimelate decarboxylase [Woeseiaceae bacterium]
MNTFAYRDGHYFAENVAVRQIADVVGTPFYCYSRAAIEARYDAIAGALKEFDALVCYAVKANSNQALIGLLAARGAGADVVSEGEMRRALAAGIPASKIVYSGVAKTVREIEFALQQDIRQFNVESEQELRVISAAAVRLNRIAHVAFRINPNVDAGTHEKISTGKAENKFGIAIEYARRAYDEARALPGIEVRGVDLHIGSQIMNLAPFEAAFSRIAELVEDLRRAGHTISTIDLGGGLGINYDRQNDKAPGIDDYAKIVRKTVGHLDCRIIVEPGRWLVGNAGVLVSSVIYTKTNGATKFLIIDAAMNDFLRPSMYNAYHSIVGEQQTDAAQVLYDIVGPVCETGDTFARKRQLPEQDAGDLVVIEGAGAYGSVMASTYNTRPLIPEVMVDGDEFRVIRQRPDYDSMIALDIPWDAAG